MIRILLLFVTVCLSFSTIKAQTFKPEIVASKTAGCPPLDVTFDLATPAPNPVTHWEWFFADDVIWDYSARPSHTFTQPGHHKVFLRMWLSSGETVSDTMDIAVLPVLDIGSQYPFCGNCVTLSNGLVPANEDPGQYLWSTGETGRTLSVCQPGTYSVAYNVCGQTLQGTATIAPPTRPASIYFGNPCSRFNLFAEFYPAYPNAPYSLSFNWGNWDSWSDWDSSYWEGTGDANLENPLIPPGVFEVKAVANYGHGCTDTVIQWLEVVDTGMLNINLGPDTTIYSGDTLQLMPPLPAPGFYFDWSTGETSLAIRVTQPGTYWVRAFSPVCHLIKTDTIHVTVVPDTLTAAIGIDSSECKTFYFHDNSYASTGKIVKWEWDFGDGGGTSKTNPMHVYTVTGTYVVKLKVTNERGRTDSAAITLRVSMEHDLNLGPDTSILPGDTLVLFAGDSAQAYQWSTGHSGKTIQVTEPGMYWVMTLYCGMIISDTINITLKDTLPVQPVTARFSIGQGDCRTVYFTDSSTVTGGGRILHWYWDFGDSHTDTVPNPVHTYAQNGDYTVRLVVTSNYNGGEQDTVIRTVPVNTIPPVVNLGPDTTLAPGDTLLLSAFNTSAVYHWSTGDTTSSIRVAAPGLYWVNVTRCGLTVSDDMRVYVALSPDSLVADFVYDTAAACLPVNIAFHDRSLSQDSITQWIWDFGDGTSPAFVKDPVHTYTTPGTYHVRLQVKNRLGDSAFIVKQLALKGPVFNVDIAVSLDSCPAPSAAVLTGNQADGDFLWSTGDTTFSIRAIQSGWYSLAVTRCGATYTDSVLVSLAPLQKPVISRQGDTLRVNNDPAYTQYQWFRNDTSLADGIGSQYIARVPGLYRVRVHNAAFCSVLSDTVLVRPADGAPVSIGNIAAVAASDTIAAEADFGHGFNSNNIFTVQLLRETGPGGRTTGATGDLTDLLSIAGTQQRVAINVVIPDTMPCSKDYRLRIIASSPADTTDWSAKFEVTRTLEARIVNSQDTLLCEGSVVTLQANTGQQAYQWYRNGAPLAGAVQPALQVSTGGAYQVKVSQSGCQQLSAAHTVQLRALPVMPVIVQRGDSLFAGEAHAWQWYKDGAVIAGATQSYYCARANGVYEVAVSNAAGCRSLSAAVPVIITAVTDVDPAAYKVTAFPNPTTGVLHLRFEKPLLKPVNINLYNNQGAPVYRRQTQDQTCTADISHLPKGVYYLEISGYKGKQIIRL